MQDEHSIYIKTSTEVVTFAQKMCRVCLKKTICVIKYIQFQIKRGCSNNIETTI